MAHRKGRFRTVVGKASPMKEPTIPSNYGPEINQKFDPYLELGATGLKRSAGYLQEEFLRELQGQRGAEAYREMRDNSAIIGAALFVIKALVKKAEWTWETPDMDLEQETPDGEGEPEVDEEGNPIEPTETPEDEPKAPLKEKRKAFPPSKPPAEPTDDGEEPADEETDEPELDEDGEPLEDDEAMVLPGGQPDPAEFMEQVFKDMSSSWPDTLTEILTFIEYGYAPMEITYKTREGTELLAEKPGESSRYDDGFIGIRKIALRAQESILEWSFDEAGGVQGLVQSAAPDYQRVEIPIQKLLLFRANTEKNNPEGRSALRSAYWDWYFSKKLTEISVIGAERDLAGLPVAKIPAQALNDSTGNVSTTYRQIVENLRADEQAGLVIPSDVDPETKVPLYDVSLMSSGGAKAFDIKALIERHESRIAMVLGAEWLLLGMAEQGARALGDSKMDTFTMALESTMDAVCEVINRHLVPRLFALNGWPLDLLPELKHGSVNREDVLASAEALKALTGAGADIFPDEKLVRHFYQLLKWPTEGRDEALLEAENNRRRMEEAMAQNGAVINPLTGQPQPAAGSVTGAPPPNAGLMAEEQKRKRAMKALHKYSSTQVNLPQELADSVRGLASLVPDDLLAEDGRESVPHITVRYGLHTDDAAEVRSVLSGQGSVVATLGALTTFSVADTGKDYEVLILPVESKDLRRLNSLLAERLAHTDTHPRYTPHVTVAYAKPGTAKAIGLLDRMDLSGERVTFGSVLFSSHDGTQEEISLLIPEPPK